MFRPFLASLVVVGLLISAAVAADSTKPITPFNGKNTEGWKLKGEAAKSKWKVGVARLDEKNNGQLTLSEASNDEQAELVNTAGGGVDISTEEKFGDCTINLEFMVPKGSNSGIYLMGEYEVQVLDSYGKKDSELGQGDLGALYSAAKPPKNAAKAPGEWQKFEIVFQSPRFEGDKKVANAKFIKVTLNGTVLHENVEMKGPTPGGLTGKEAATGPLMFQGDHGAVAFRKIEIVKK
jgi:hypothetical protein